MVYRAFFDNVFSGMDPEKAHERAFAAIRAGRVVSPIVPKTRAPRTVMGIEFPHAFGLAAGFDKNAAAVPGLLALGFGHVEIGTVTAQAQLLWSATVGTCHAVLHNLYGKYQTLLAGLTMSNAEVQRLTAVPNRQQCEAAE